METKNLEKIAERADVADIKPILPVGISSIEDFCNKLQKESVKGFSEHYFGKPKPTSRDYNPRGYKGCVKKFKNRNEGSDYESKLA
ncbi:Uncharacterised protein [Candidatus Tiddalikarchaeum anstoanum]|nr:Uncharacterised protein [Candidatus Tiddalikarchaeum anstoanum]